MSLIAAWPRVALAAALTVLAIAPRPAMAEAASVRIAEPAGFDFLPIRAAVVGRMIERHAKNAGLGDVKVVVRRFDSGIAVNQAIFSGHADVGGADLVAMLALWDRTRGTPFEARAMLALAAVPLAFVTVDPRVGGFKDYDGLADHRIAVPDVLVSLPAVLVRMGAERTFGPGGARRLDPLLTALTPAGAEAAIAAGGRQIRTHVASLPHSFWEVSAGPGRVVVRSPDIVGGPHTSAVLMAARAWKERNPKLFRAVADAMIEAQGWIEGDSPRAARFFREQTKSKRDISEIEAMFAAMGESMFGPVPRNTLPIAAFLERLGAIKTRASSWRDYFWEPAHAFDGG
ncbi:MAG: ABC transporter substrate-binding protein [Rhodospirillales bacterium]|nr:ABC transporter substrate-binding protein [Rhodospirillales bacterium]